MTDYPTTKDCPECGTAMWVGGYCPECSEWRDTEELYD